MGDAMSNGGIVTTVGLVIMSALVLASRPPPLIINLEPSDSVIIFPTGRWTVALSTFYQYYAILT
jgi:hypothetical protein